MRKDSRFHDSWRKYPNARDYSRAPRLVHVPIGAQGPVAEAALERNGLHAAFRPAHGHMGALVLAAVVLAAFRFAPSLRPHTVAVLPVRWISNAYGLDQADAGIAEAVDGELANRDIARVIAWPVMLRYQTAHRSSQSIGAELGASTLIVIAVRDADRGKLVSAFLMDTASGQKRRVTSYTLADVSALAAQRSVAHQIVGDLEPLLGR